MSDSFTEITRQSWGSRLKGSFKGIFVGLILIAVAFILLFKNEGRAVKRYKTLKEGKGVVVSVSSASVAPANEAKLVHLSGRAETEEVLIDPEFGVSVNAIHLERRVEMYQWRERAESTTEKKLGGGTETRTTYSYSTGWEGRLIRSREFRNPEGHENPATMPFDQRKTSALGVRLGAFRLSPGLIDRMGDYEPVRLTSLAALPAPLAKRAHLVGDSIYLGADPTKPRVGDLRISFRQVRPGMVSIVAQQNGNSFQPFRSRAGGTVELLTPGQVPAEQMFESAQQANKTLTWVLRVVGFLLMLVGLKALFQPLSTLADVVPMIGNLVGKGTGFFAFLLASFLSLTTIALAWFFYRPLIGVPLLLGAAAVGFLVVRKVTRARRAAALETPPPPPPPPPPPAPESA